MSPIDLEELAALDAVGALTEDEQRTLRERLSSASPGERQAAAQMYDLALAVVTSSVTSSATSGVEGRAGAACEPPRPQVRAQLLARISSPRSFSVLSSDGQWMDTDIPGLAMKVLSHDRERDSAVLLMRARGGVRYPAHHHGGAEECYVVSGEVRVQGRTLHAGDFHHAEPGSDHDELYTETGAEILLVVAASDYGLM